MTGERCHAQVAVGSYTYNARNTSRRCGNPARDNGFCHLHQRYVAVSPIDKAEFEQLRAMLAPKVTPEG